MAAQEVPRKDWNRFLTSYSRIHHGWPVTMDILTPEFGNLTEVRRMPLRGISVEGREGEERISIMVCDSERNHTTHTITRPQRLRHDRSPASADEVIELDSALGTTVVLTLHSAVPAEMLDAAVE